jgi:hypothetical protein
MSASYNPNMGFQGKAFDSGGGICNPINEKEYYNTQYTPMFDGKGGAAKKAKKTPSTKKPAKKTSSTKKPAKKPAKKRGGSDAFDEIDKINSSLTWATQAGGTELASEYYTSAQQGSYAPYNASKDEKCGGGRKKGVHRGGISMGSAESRMGSSMVRMNGSIAAADNATKGGSCGCGYKMKTSGAKHGGSDGYYADTVTGDDPVVERKSKLDGQLDGGAAKAKKRSSSKGTKKPKAKSSSKGTKKTTKPKSSRKHKGGDDSAGVGSDFATTLASRGPCNYPDGKSADLFRIFNKTSEFIPNSMLKYAAAPQSTGYSPDPNPYPRAYNDDFVGGTKKRKPAKKSASSKAKAKPAKKSASSKAKAKPAKKSTSSKTKKH